MMRNKRLGRLSGRAFSPGLETTKYISYAAYLYFSAILATSFASSVSVICSILALSFILSIVLATKLPFDLAPAILRDFSSQSTAKTSCSVSFGAIVFMLKQGWNLHIDHTFNTYLSRVPFFINQKSETELIFFIHPMLFPGYLYPFLFAYSREKNIAGEFRMHPCNVNPLCLG